MHFTDRSVLMSYCSYQKRFDEILVDYFIKQHNDDLQSVLLAKDVDRHYAVAIEAPLLFDFCLELRGLLLSNPSTVLPRFDAMLEKSADLLFDNHPLQNEMSLKKRLHARITGLVFYPELNRNVIPRSTDVGLFVSISGIIVRASLVQLLQSAKKYVCSSCKHSFSVKNDHEQFNKIKGRLRCPNPDSCPSTKFSVADTDDTDQWCDYQEVKLQERVQALSVRVIPRTISVVLENDLVDSCKPGDDVTVVGIMCRRWRTASENVRCHVQHLIKANHVQINNQRCHPGITSNMQRYFEDFWSDYKDRPLEGRNEIIQSLCPQIYGLFQVKLAVALILAGGVSKSDESGTRVRGESHMLLIGDPGTGKSQFLKYAAKITPRSVFTTGIGSTSAGLTVSAVKDGGEWQLEAGALVLADGGLCCIDEFNSIKENDKSSILEAMEQQTISVAKAGLICKMNTRCTILAATNPKGNYDPNMAASINIALSSPLLSRFDLIFVVMDTKNDDWDQLVSNYVLHGLQPFGNNSCKMNMNKMQSYFSIVKQLKPVLSVDANMILQQYYLAHRKSDERNVIRTTVRLLESVVRLSEAHAKLMFRSKVLIVDAIVAVLVMESSLGGLGLIGTENILHTNFPTNPDQLYEEHGKIVMKKLGLEEIWKKANLQGVNNYEPIVMSQLDTGHGEASNVTLLEAVDQGQDIRDISTVQSSQERLSLITAINSTLEAPLESNSSVNNSVTKIITEKTEVPHSTVSLKTMKKLEKFTFTGCEQFVHQTEQSREMVTSTPKESKLLNLAYNFKENSKNQLQSSSKTLSNANNIQSSIAAEIHDFCSLNENDLTLDWL